MLAMAKASKGSGKKPIGRPPGSGKAKQNSDAVSTSSNGVHKKKTTKEVVVAYLSSKYGDKEANELYNNAEATSRIVGAAGFFTYIEAMCNEAGLSYNHLLRLVKENKEGK